MITHTSPNTTVIIPAYNEADMIGQTICSVNTIPSVNQIIVIDDGSKDGTFAVSAINGARVLRLKRNYGKGQALTVGIIEAIKNYNQDYFLFIDADLGDTAEQSVLLLEPVISKRCDMAIATFPSTSGKVGFGLVKNFASLAYKDINPTFESKTPVSGQRALSAETLEKLLPLESGFGVEVGLTIKALQQGMDILEVDTQMSHRQYSNDLSGYLHRFKQFKDIRKTISKLFRD